MKCHEFRFHMLTMAISALFLILFSIDKLSTEAQTIHHTISQIENPNIQLLSVAWRPNGSQIAFGTTRGLDIYDIKTARINALYHANGPISPITWSPDGNNVAGVQQDEHKILVWAVDGHLVGDFVGNIGYLWSIAWNRNHLLATGEWRKASIWDTESFQLVKEIYTDDSDVLGLAWNSDGQRLALVLNVGGMEIWNTTKGNKVTTINSDRGVQSTSWSPDGKRIVTGGGYSSNATTECTTCVTWDPQIWFADGTLWRAFHGHSDIVMVVKWSPDGKYILTGSRNNEFIIWDAATGKRIETLDFTLNSFNPLVMDYSIDWSPDGRYLALVTASGHLGIWDIVRQRMLLDLNLETI